jgi:hypothetical protein
VPCFERLIVGIFRMKNAAKLKNVKMEIWKIKDAYRMFEEACRVMQLPLQGAIIRLTC